jgi:hypothetical protein
MAHAGSSDGDSSPEISLASGGQVDKIDRERYSVFFRVQRPLVEVLDGAPQALNDYRKKLGLTPVDSDHPSLIPPELSDAYNDLIVLSVPTARRDIVARRVSARTRRGNKAGQLRKPRPLRRGLSKGKNKSGSLTMPRQNQVSEATLERNEEDGAWV